MLVRTHFVFPGFSEIRYVERLPEVGSEVRGRNAIWWVHETGVDEHGFDTVVLAPNAPADSASTRGMRGSAPASPLDPRSTTSL